MSIPVSNSLQYSGKELNDIVYPDEIAEPLYVVTIVAETPYFINGLLLERQYLCIPDEWKQKCRLATEADLKGKDLGPRCYLEESLSRCNAKKGIPWSKAAFDR